MFTWLLLFLALALAWLGLLTTRRSPDWNEWRLAVCAGEYGHWLALAALAVAVAAGSVGRNPVGWIAAGLAVMATGLLLKPALQARRVARTLESQCDRFGAPAVPRRAFSWRGLLGRAPLPVEAETFAFAGALEMDVYRLPSATSRPGVLVIHGGGWDGGDRGQMRHFNHWLARRGYVVAAISYRLAPVSKWPAQREDVRAALAFLQERAPALGLDASRLVLLGRSAGGQIAQTAAYTLGEPGIRGVVGLYAPADLLLGYRSGREDDVLQSRRLLRQYLGGSPDEVRGNYADASATSHVRPESPPTLLLHGRLDPLVWHRHSERLAARLSAAGVPHVAIQLPWATHAFEFNLCGPGGQLTTYALERFLARVTR